MVCLPARRLLDREDVRIDRDDFVREPLGRRGRRVRGGAGGFSRQPERRQKSGWKAIGGEPVVHPFAIDASNAKTWHAASLREPVRWLHPKREGGEDCHCTPLSFGLLNASLIAGVCGKFMLIPLGGIGLVNHLA